PLSVVRCPLSVVRCPLSVVRCPLSVVRCPLSVVRCEMMINGYRNTEFAEEFPSLSFFLLVFSSFLLLTL
ncbi:MAG: hypothetical protein ACK45Z_20930, partial [Dolichospermum sp.]